MSEIMTTTKNILKNRGTIQKKKKLMSPKHNKSHILKCYNYFYVIYNSLPFPKDINYIIILCLLQFLLGI